MKSIVCLLFAWWFLVHSGPGAGRVVGPFSNEQDCNTFRTEYAGLLRSVSKRCWYGEWNR